MGSTKIIEIADSLLEEFKAMQNKQDADQLKAHAVFNQADLPLSSH